MSIQHFSSVVFDSGPSVVLQNDTVFDFSVVPAAASATIELNSSGLQRAASGGLFSTVGTWLLRGVNSDYEVFATLNSGSLSSGTTGAWLGLGTSRAWSVNTTGAGFDNKAAGFTLTIRRAVSPFTTLTSAVMSVEATTEI